MDAPLQMLEAWDAGQPVATLRLTQGGPVQEQSAHLALFEIVRDAAGLPLPDAPGDWGPWGADAVTRVRALPGVDLPPSTVSTVKAYAYHLLKSGWEPLAAATPPMNHITVCRHVPGGEPPVSPKTVAAAKDHDRLAAWILTELPEEIRGDLDDVSAAGIAIRLLTDWKARRTKVVVTGGAPEPHAHVPVPALAELLQDLEDRLGDKLELTIGQAVAPLAARLSMLEGQGRAAGNRKPSQPTATEPGPVIVATPEGKGPAVVEGKRPTGKTSYPELEHQPPRGRER